MVNAMKKKSVPVELDNAERAAVGALIREHP